MLMKDKNKSMATLIMSKMKNRPGPLQEAPQSAGAEVADADELYMMAEDVMKALETRDIRAFKDSLEAMISVCMNKAESNEHENEALTEMPE